MNHKDFSLTIANGGSMQGATTNSSPELVEAYAEMAPVGARPSGRVGMRLMDAGRGRPVNPLGCFPRDAQVIARSGKSTYYRIVKPLLVQMASIRVWCGFGVNVSMTEAITNAEKEGAESDVRVLGLALVVNHPTASALASADKELREEIEAKTILAEKIEDAMAAS